MLWVQFLPILGPYGLTSRLPETICLSSVRYPRQADRLNFGPNGLVGASASRWSEVSLLRAALPCSLAAWVWCL